MSEESSLEGDWYKEMIQNHGEWWKKKSVFSLEKSLPMFGFLCGSVKEVALERTWNLERCHLRVGDKGI